MEKIGKLNLANIFITSLCLALAGCSEKDHSPAAQIHRIIPDSGNKTLLNLITIEGAHFKEGATVDIGGAPCQNPTLLPQQIRCTAPTHSHAKSVDVSVTNPGEQATVLPLSFQYLDPPVPVFPHARIIFIDPQFINVHEISPISIHGQDFQAGAQVTLDGTPCTNVVVRNPYQITCNALVHRPGRVHVTLTHPDGTVIVANFLFDILAPVPAAPIFPHAQIVWIQPEFINMNQMSTITITGLNFRTGAQVTLGGTPCMNVVVLDPNQIRCDALVLRAGEVHVRVTYPGEIGVPEHFPFNILNPNRARPAPVPAAPAPTEVLQVEAMPAVTVREYRNSEAEALAQARIVRLANGGNQSHLLVRGRQISFDVIPEAQIMGYVIQDSELARAVRMAVGDILTQEQIEQHHYTNELQAALDDVRITRMPGAINPAYNARPVTPQEEADIAQLRLQIKNRIRLADQAAPIINGRHWYLSPASINGQLYVNPDYGAGNIIQNTDVNHFSVLLTAIQENNQNEAMNRIATLATHFDRNHSVAKTSFIDTFTFLYVTKEFPSEGMLITYLHFILRCGHIH